MDDRISCILRLKLSSPFTIACVYYLALVFNGMDGRNDESIGLSYVFRDK